MTADEVIIYDVVYSTPTSYAINTEEALNTFVRNDGSAAGASIAIAAAIYFAAVVVTTCTGVIFGETSPIVLFSYRYFFHFDDDFWYRCCVSFDRHDDR